MEQKKELAKVALAALLLASAAPVQAIFDNGVEAQGTYLAAKCAAHGCGSVADNSGNKSDMYNTRSNSYQMEEQPAPSDSQKMQRMNQPSNDPYRMNAPRENEGTLGYNYSQQGYNSQQSTLTPHHLEDYRQISVPSKQYPAGSTTMPDINRNYSTDYDYNRRAMPTINSAATLTEAQLLGMLNQRAKNLYLSLDQEGRSLAIQLASQDSYRDKNLAIMEAQRRMSERRGMMNR